MPNLEALIQPIWTVAALDALLLAGLFAHAYWRAARGR